MVVREITSQDQPAIQAWYEKRNLIYNPALLPKQGLIVPGIAAGYLMQTDCSVCILEPFIANPDSTSEDRDEALNLILAGLVSIAKELNYSHAFGFTTSQTMLTRSLNQGFKVQDVSTTVVKEL